MIVDTEKQREVIRVSLFLDFLKRGPRTDDELHFFVKEFLHLNIPRTSVCNNHDNHFEFLADLFFERKLFVFVYGSRASGKTNTVAVLNKLDVLFKGVEVTSAGAVLKQAEKCYEYFHGFFADPIIQKHVPVFKANQSETRLFNGGVLKVITGTVTGLSGQHPNKARIDEVELLDWSVFQTGLSMSMTKTNKYGTWRGQDVLLSTRLRSHGTVQRLLDDQEKMGLTVYSWCVFETMEKCHHDCFDFGATHKDDLFFKDVKKCPLYSRLDKNNNEQLFCGGQAHKSDGFYIIEDVIQKVKGLDWEVIEAQWLCKKPSEGTSVYAEFMDESSHLIGEEELLKLASYDDIQNYWEHEGGIDFGGHHCTLIGVRDPKTGIEYIVGEHYATEDILNAEHKIRIKDLMYFKPRMPFYADRSSPQSILEFQTQPNGLNCIASISDVFPGIDAVKAKLQRRPDGKYGMYFLRGRTTMLVKEMCTYSYKIGADGKPDRDTIWKRDDHAPDALRYKVFTPGKLQQKYAMTKIRL